MVNGTAAEAPPPGAEGQDAGIGEADEYLGTPEENYDVPVESKLSLEEQKVLKEANGKKDVTKIEQAAPEKEEKKKKGFFRRLFGKKDDDN